MRIVIFEDSSEEANRAIDAVKAAGHEPVLFDGLSERYPKPSVWQEIETADGVITDLYFNPYRSNSEVMRQYHESPPPSGLVVALHAVYRGKPVVICTSGNHHGAELSFIFDAYVSVQENKPDYEGWGDKDTPFGWEERKDWTEAVKQLEKRHAASLKAVS